MSLPVFDEEHGEPVWREEVNSPPDWTLDADEIERGPRTPFKDGIYVVTVGEKVPSGWIELARRVTIVSDKQHPGPDFLPGYNYVSAVAVTDGRIVGAALAGIECVTKNRWRVSLRENGEAYGDELFGAAAQECGVTFDSSLRLRPGIYTIWVHPAHRNKSIGGQLVKALADHFSLGPADIGYRLPLSKLAVHMVNSIGLKELAGFY